MAEKYNDDYESANKALIARESAKLERARARAESLEATMTKGLAAGLKASRQNIAREAVRATTRADSGQLSATERAMVEAAQKGVDRINIDEGIITGESESRYSYDDDDV